MNQAKKYSLKNYIVNYGNTYISNFWKMSKKIHTIQSSDKKQFD